MKTIIQLQATDLCSDRARGAAIGATIGATIMGGFGAAWLFFGLTSAGIGTGVALAVVLPVAALIAGLGSLVRRRVPSPAMADSTGEKARGQILATINVVQWLAIFGTLTLLRNLHLEAWSIPAIVLIVGAHFLPLAQLFRTRLHAVTGMAMMLCAASSIVLPAASRDSLECLIAGVILWVSAACALRASFRMTTHWPAPAPQSCV